MIEEDLWVKKGDCVNSFEGANDAIGTLVLKFKNEVAKKGCIRDIPSWLKVKVS